MHSHEQQLIEGLFSRLQQAASQSGPRDAAAEQLISQQSQQVPSAPYYMTQTLLIQEAAMKQLEQRVRELENQLAAAQETQPKQHSGGFLDSLFSGKNNYKPAAAATNTMRAAPESAPAPPSPQIAAPQMASRGSGFLGSALQTAVGVAGGVVMANMLTNMFHRTPPQEIVNIIENPPLPQNDFSASDHSFLDQNAGWQDAGFTTNDFDDIDNDTQSSYDDDGFI